MTGMTVTPAQRGKLHDIATAPAGSALIVGKAGPPDDLPDGAVAITLDDVIPLQAAGLVAVSHVTDRGYFARITDAGLALLATVVEEETPA